MPSCSPSPDCEGELLASTPEAWSWSDTATGAGELDAAQLALDLQANMDALTWVRATDPLNSFRAVLTYATQGCPNAALTTTEEYGTTYYFDGLCIDSSGAYKGPGLLYTWVDNTINSSGALGAAYDLPPGSLWTGFGFNGQTDIFADDGSFDFNCSCTMVDATGITIDGLPMFFGITQGTAHWTGPEAFETWMENPSIIPEILIIGTGTPEARSVNSQGSLSGVGERYSAMAWDLSVHSVTEAGQIRCTTGEMTAKIRDEVDLSWFELEFAVDEHCQACTETESGESACADLTSVVDWEESPWR